VLRLDSVSVVIYKTPSKGYDTFTLAYYQDGHRRREYSNNYSTILKRANEILDDLRQGKPAVEGALKTAERLEFVRAKENLKSKNITLPLDVVARHFAEAVKLLGSDLVIEAAREYAKRHPQKLPQKTVAEVADEFIAAKRQFKAVVQGNISQMDAEVLRSFLDGLTKADGAKISPRSYNNFRLALNTLFQFAKKRKYLPTDWNEFEAVEIMKDSGGAIEIFTPDEIAKLLAAADRDLIPFLALGAFAGLRSAEIERLDWRDVKFETGFVIVEAGKAKTATRRQVEMRPNLRAWLEPLAKIEGRVIPYADDELYKELRAVSDKAKVPWKNNALRHGFISYRVAETGDVNRTALEAGNTATMIFSHYRELVTPQQAKTWFGIWPKKISKRQRVAKV